MWYAAGEMGAHESGRRALKAEKGTGNLSQMYVQHSMVHGAKCGCGGPGWLHEIAKLGTFVNSWQLDKEATLTPRLLTHRPQSFTRTEYF
jgi:hypothetical protein